MSKIFNAVSKILKKKNDHTVQESNKGKRASKKTDEKQVIKQVEKKRNMAKNTALHTLNELSKNLETYNKNLTPSDTVEVATEAVINEIEQLKDLFKKMTPETLVPMLEEQKEKWLDEKNINVEGENYAQMELDKSEIYKRRNMAAKKCDIAIDVLRKQIEEEKNKG